MMKALLAFLLLATGVMLALPGIAQEVELAVDLDPRPAGRMRGNLSDIGGPW